MSVTETPCIWVLVNLNLFTKFNLQYFYINFCYYFADFDDDDPLAGLLSDDEDTKPKAKTTAGGRRGTPKKEEEERPHTGPTKDDGSNSPRKAVVNFIV